MSDSDDATATKPRPLFQTPILRVPQFRQATPAPTPAPVPSPHAGAALDDLYTAAAAMQDSMLEQAAMLHRLCDAVQDAVTLLRKASRHGVNATINLSASRPYTLDTLDYEHSYLLLSATQTVLCDVPGVGIVSRSLNADWNRLDYPSGTRLYLGSEPTSPVNGLLRLSDELINV